jgi:hypothetical protein
MLLVGSSADRELGDAARRAVVAGDVDARRVDRHAVRVSERRGAVLYARGRVMMTDDFTFSSAAGDDHISKSTYRAQCCETQKGRIASFEVEQLSENGDEAFVKYTCRTKSGKVFRNVEYFHFRGSKIAFIECFFGDATRGYPTATDKAGGRAHRSIPHASRTNKAGRASKAT